MTNAALFAQEAAGKGEEGKDGFDFTSLLPLLAIGVLFYFMMIRPQSREKAKRQQLLDSLKKNDKVVTIGGILGSIASISPDSDEVTVKVDDNTRIRFRRSSIQQVVGPESQTDKN